MNETILCYQEYGIDNYDSLQVSPDSICSLLLQDSLKGEHIYISNNIIHFNNLIELEVIGDGILRMSNLIGALTKLRSLEIECQIDDLSIPDSLNFCDNLEIIDFSGEKNAITKLPEALFGLEKLKFLTINMVGVSDKKIVDDIFNITLRTNIEAVILYNFKFKRSDKRRLMGTGKVAFM